MLVLSAVLAGCAGARTQTPGSASSGVRAEVRDRALSDMAVIISSTIGRQDTKHQVFHGSLDWHSAVHGHWALLRVARVLPARADLSSQAVASLDPVGLAGELEFLKEHPDFERPYGRSWLLRLAVEYELWCRETGAPDPMRLRALADEAARSLLAYYSEFAPTPFTHTYNNASWSMVQLHEYFRHTADKAGLEKVSAMIRGNFLEPGMRGFSTDFSSPEFFSPYGNWAYLLAKSQDSGTLDKFLRRWPGSEKDISPLARLVPNPHSASKGESFHPHQLGMNWSRAWALKRLGLNVGSASERDRYTRAYGRHVEQGLKHHARYAGDFGSYDHWVPQFAVYALTEGALD